MLYTDHSEMNGNLPNQEYSLFLWHHEVSLLIFDQERDHKAREQELTEDVRQRDKHIDIVEKQLAEINQDINKLAKQLEFKGQEVLKVKSEAEEQLRWVGTIPLESLLLTLNCWTRLWVLLDGSCFWCRVGWNE